MKPPERELRVAVLVPGGVGPPGSPHRVPSLAGLLEQLSRRVSLQVFSLTPQPYPAGKRPPFLLWAPACASPQPGRAMAALVGSFLHAHRHKRFHLIHAFWALPAGLLAGWLSHGCRMPALLTLMGGETARLRRPAYGNCHRPMHRWLTRLACRLATAVIVLSNHQAGQLARLHWPARQVQAIPFGPMPAFFRNRPAVLTPPFRLLQVANLTPVKDPLSLLRVAAQLKRQVPLRLDVVGPDHWQGTVHRLCTSLGLRAQVCFHGWVDHQRLPALYHSAQIYLQTSLHEAQGVSVAEAAAAGLLLAGTHTGLLADLVPEAALSVAPGDWQELALRLGHLLKQPEKALPLQKRALAWARAHPFEGTVQAYWYLYRALAGTRSQAAEPQVLQEERL